MILMILLLPLRGWVGDAMAGQMLQEQAAAAVEQQAAPAAHGHDCDQHGSPGADEQDSASQAQPGTDCPTCAACQVCSSVAFWPPVTSVPLPSFPHPAPQA